MRNILESIDRSELQGMMPSVPCVPRVRMMARSDTPDCWVMMGGAPLPGIVPPDVVEVAAILQQQAGESLVTGPVVTPASRWVAFVNPKVGGNAGNSTCVRGHAALARKLRSLSLKAVVVGAQALPPDIVDAQIQGLRLGWYSYPTPATMDPPEILVPAFQERTPEALEESELFTQATTFARLWTEEPPNRLTPMAFAHMAAQLGRKVGLSVEVLDVDQIREIRMGGVLAVGQGSMNAPAVVKLQYLPELRPRFGIVGKGVTFDSGGISLKPSDNLRKLKGDKAGASAVLAASLAAAQMGISTPFVAILPLAENMPSSSAYRPGDVVTMFDGTTVEIVSTDAEGRLLLADGMSLAMRENCEHTFTVATLTRASMIALGNFRAALYSGNDELADQISKAADFTGELVWRMPLDEDYALSLRSAVADLMNSADSPNGGSIVAAKFLQRFSKGRSWAHLDMSPIFYLDNEMPWGDKGYTGAGARLVLALLAGRGAAVPTRE